MSNPYGDRVINEKRQILLHKKLDMIIELLLLLLKENQPNTMVQYMLLSDELEKLTEELRLK